MVSKGWLGRGGRGVVKGRLGGGVGGGRGGKGRLGVVEERLRVVKERLEAVTVLATGRAVRGRLTSNTHPLTHPFLRPAAVQRIKAHRSATQPLNISI